MPWQAKTGLACAERVAEQPAVSGASGQVAQVFGTHRRRQVPAQPDGAVTARSMVTEPTSRRMVTSIGRRLPKTLLRLAARERGFHAGHPRRDTRMRRIGAHHRGTARGPIMTALNSIPCAGSCATSRKTASPMMSPPCATHRY